MYGRQTEAMLRHIQEIVNDWNDNGSQTVTSLPVWEVDNFRRWVFVAQSVPEIYREQDR